MKKKHIALAISLVVLVMIGVAVIAALRGRKIVVASDTTYLTAPLAEDGLPDYNGWIIAELMDGVTPENNAAIPLWEAMGCGEVAIDERTALFAVLQMPIPSADPGKFVATGGPLPDAVKEELGQAQAKRMGEEQGVEEGVSEEPAQVDQVEADQEGSDPTANAPEVVGQDAVEEGGAMIDYGMMSGADSPSFPIADDVIQDAMDQPWKSEESPAIAAWIERRQAEYDLLHDAAARPKFASPSPTLLVGSHQSLVYCTMPHHQMLRSAMRNLSLRAMLRTGESQYELAWEDCRAMLALANHIPMDSLVGCLVRIACRQLAIDKTVTLLQYPLPIELIEEIEGEVAKWPALPPLQQCIDKYERLIYVTSCISLSGQRGNVSGSPDVPAILQSSLAVDWNGVMRRGNKTYDDIVTAFSKEDWQQRQSALDEYNSDIFPIKGPRLRQLLTRAGRTQLAGDVAASLLFPSVQPLAAAEDRERVMHNLLQVAVALARFRAETGDYPKALAELDVAPNLLKDFRHGKPYGFRWVDGGYLLYSLGTNGKDDDGSHALMNKYRGVNLEIAEWLDDSEAPANAGPEWRLNLSSGAIEGADDESVRLPTPRRESLGKRSW